jgi:hypothetical protein
MPLVAAPCDRLVPRRKCNRLLWDPAVQAPRKRRQVPRFWARSIHCDQSNRAFQSAVQSTRLDPAGAELHETAADEVADEALPGAPYRGERERGKRRRLKLFWCNRYHGQNFRE